MSKLTWHFQTLGTEVDAIAAASGARYVKVMDPPEQNPFPGKIIIGRTYLRGRRIKRACCAWSSGADTWFDRFWPFYQSRPYVTWWEGRTSRRTSTTRISGRRWSPSRCG